LELSKGIEIGHIFMLQQGYAEKMGVTFLSEDGERHTPYMGCYGVGTTRCIQALVEQNNDEHGIKWPKQVAPFRYVIVPTTFAEGSVQRQVAENLYETLALRGEEVVLDDREMGFGAKMKDALLIGYPEIVVVGRGAKQGKVELQNRFNLDERQIVSVDEI
jgi:prolyl-tRNA synthetase